MSADPAPVILSVSSLQPSLSFPPTPERAAILDDIAGRITQRGNGRQRVAVDGMTAAGKSTFGHQLAQAVSRAGRPVLRACLDDFKKPWRDRHLYDRTSGEGYYRNAFDYAAVRALLLEPGGPAGSGRCVLCLIDPLTQVDHRDEVAQAADDAVLLVDGVFAFRPEINRFWDFRIWLDIDAESALRRGVARDTAWAGAEAEEIHRSRYHVAEQIYVDEVDPRSMADVILDNSRPEAPSTTP